MAPIKNEFPAVEFLSEVSSTQDEAAKRLALGKSLPFAVAASRQSAGRGTHSRVWESPECGVLLTLAVRPNLLLSSYAGLTLSLSTAVAELLHTEKNVPAQIKWPNDLYLGERKFSGLMIEVLRDRNRSPVFVIGTGINITSANPQFADLGAYYAPGDARALSQRVSDAILGALSSFEQEGFAAFEPFWTQAAYGIGKKASLVENGSVTASGTFAGADSLGRAVLESGAGKECFFSGSLVFDSESGA